MVRWGWRRCFYEGMRRGTSNMLGHVGWEWEDGWSDIIGRTYEV